MCTYTYIYIFIYFSLQYQFYLVLRTFAPVPFSFADSRGHNPKLSAASHFCVISPFILNCVALKWKALAVCTPDTDFDCACELLLDSGRPDLKKLIFLGLKFHILDFINFLLYLLFSGDHLFFYLISCFILLICF